MVFQKGNIPHNMGKESSPETCLKISENHADMSGENNPMFGRTGEKSPLFGKKQSKECREKRSETFRKNSLFPDPTIPNKTCNSCGKNFFYPRKHGLKEWENKKFCSKECAYKGRDMPYKGKHLPEETCQKMKDNHADVSGELNPCFGRTGDKNPAYKNPEDRITPLYAQIRTCSKYFEWRTSIYQRDLFICQACKKKSEGDLEAHHIKFLSVLVKQYNITTLEEALAHTELWNLDNGITLCEKCHGMIHFKNSEQVGV